MKRWAAHHYRDPQDGSPLRLVAMREERIEIGGAQRDRLHHLGIPPEEACKIVSWGALVNDQTGVWYPIVNYIPILLDYATEAHDLLLCQEPAVAKVVDPQLRPTGTPRPGERLSRETFGAEWAVLPLDDPLSFTYTRDERKKFIALELDSSRALSASNEARILDIGCGAGWEAALLADVTGVPVFAVDINKALLRIGPVMRNHVFAHIAMASLFALPFDRHSFSLVYSHGVLHHTHNTEHAFCVANSYRRAGGDIYIWVYALEDCLRGGAIKTLVFLIEQIVRPAIAKAPTVVQSAIIKVLAVLHYLRYRRKGLKRGLWKFANSEHSMRDRWTCLYAHRHSVHEVLGWFVRAGLVPQFVDPVAYRKEMGRNLIGIGVLGRDKNAKL